MALSSHSFDIMRRHHQHATGLASAPRLPASLVSRAAPHARNLTVVAVASESVDTSSAGADGSSPSTFSAAAPTTAWNMRLLKLGNQKSRRKAERAELFQAVNGMGGAASDTFDPSAAQNKAAKGSSGGGGGRDGFDYGDNEFGGEADEDDTKKRLPAEMRCFDSARLYIRSGDGGNGCVAFRREKFVEFGGPSGGNGGHGGNVWAVVDPDANSLYAFRGKVHWRALGGVSGQGSQLHGANAPDLIVPVPAGTVIRKKDAEEGEPPMAELVKIGDKALLMVGGRGGRGNESFKTHNDTAPTIAEKGEEGSDLWLDLELKVVADVGIIGIPNAGKSTLLSTLTSARPKIANYPFTTLVPNLGVCEMDYRTTVFADVPGLLEGAHEGLGLGHEFLRHVQRCRALVHVIDGSSPDPMGDFRAINLELELFNPELRDKPQVVAYNKIDLPDSGDYVEVMIDELKAAGVREDRIFPVSAATGVGVIDIVRAVRRMLDDMGPPGELQTTNAVNMTTLPKKKEVRIDDFKLDVEEDGEGIKTYFVEGEAIQKFAQMTNWDYYESVKRFQKVLDSSGVNSALKVKGVKQGDTVVVAGSAFEWQDDQSTGALFDSYIRDMAEQGKNRQGTASWPKPMHRGLAKEDTRKYKANRK